MNVYPCLLKMTKPILIMANGCERDDFVPFNNTMTINLCRSLPRKEIEFLVEEMTVIYHMEISKRENENNEENNYIKGVYDFHILPLIHFKELVHELQEKLKANNILELTLKKDARRKIHVY